MCLCVLANTVRLIQLPRGRERSSMGAKVFLMLDLCIKLADGNCSANENFRTLMLYIVLMLFLSQLKSSENYVFRT